MIDIPNTWLLFTIAFGIMLFATYIMGLQSGKLYTKFVVQRTFSIMDLEFPTSALEMSKILSGIFKIPDVAIQKASLRALKNQLLVDFFLFMPGAYGGIFIMSMKVASKMSSSFGYGAFIFFAWAQLLCFLLDVIENVYIWRKIVPDATPSSPQIFAAYKLLEVLKWGLSLLAAVCCFSSLLYFWITGHYAASSYNYIIIAGVELVAFLAVSLLSKKPADPQSPKA